MRPGRRLRAQGLATLIAAAACPAGAQAGEAPGWLSYERPAAWEAHARHVRVPVRDGAHLACDLYRPARDGRPAPGRVPGIVLDYTPYAALADLDSPETASFYASRGYAVLVCDVRGTGGSSGRFPGWFQPVEAQDDFDVVEWLAAQPFSSGRVGQEGFSYGAIAAYRVAALRPPHLVAVAAQMAANSLYEEFAYPGGIRAAGDDTWAASAFALSYGRADPVSQWRIWREHPLLDGYWRQVDLPRHLAAVQVPVLGFGGWYDLFRDGMPSNHVALGERHRLVMGPWRHERPWSDGATRGATLAWWDFWLMQRPDAPALPARVTSWEMPRREGGGWQELPDWPPPDAGPLRLHFTRERGLSERPGPAGDSRYAVDPWDGPPSHWSGDPVHPEDRDQREADRRRLTFTTAPLDRDLVIAGAVEVSLRAALSATDGNLVVKLMDVAPSGRSSEAAVGYLKASHRESHERAVPVPPGRAATFRIRLSHVHWRVRAGHRLRFSLTSGDFPRLAPDAPPGTVTVATGEGGSSAALPVRGMAASTAIDLPRAHDPCADRVLRLRARRPARGRVRAVRAYVDGRLVLAVSGRRARGPLVLRGLPRRPFVLRVVVHTSRGGRLARVLRHRGC